MRGLVYFHSTSGHTASDVRRFEHPVRIVEARCIEEVPEALDATEQAVSEGFFAAGYVAYEAGAAFETTVPRRLIHIPYAWFGIYADPSIVRREELTRLREDDEAAVRNLRFSIPWTRYRKQVAAIRQLIREGDVYQVNYTGQLRFDIDGSPEALFARLVDRQPVPYAAYLDIGAAHIVSCSPELFFRRSGRRIVTRPMKGTAPRGRSPQDDAAAERRLAQDDKNRSENLMIVDLLRNDLSKCCVPGSVRVSSLFGTERYETLIQMTSQIEGELQTGTGLQDIFRALFPCGSVTGAPKIRAMQRIDELEDEPRSLYCGAVGWMAPGGDAEFSVAIRTAEIVRNAGRLGIGSGVVWDSEPETEYAETLLKSRFFTGTTVSATDDFHLIETMRFENGKIPLLELHLDRLSASADHFGIPLNRDDARSRILRVIDSTDSQRVRLTLDSHGHIAVESHIIGPAPARWRCMLSPDRIDSNDPLRRHKTSLRDLYTEKYKEAVAMGFDEILFLNNHGELVEGSRSNIFVRTGGMWRTPPLESGGLPGIYRRFLLESIADASPVALYIRDLMEADAVFVCNAVNGLVPAEIVLPDAAFEKEVSVDAFPV